MIRQGAGRIIHIGSVAGVVAIPYASPLSASKFAMESFYDALRLELKRWKIPVIVIRPGLVATAAGEQVANAGEKAFEQLPPDGRERYPSFRQTMAQMALDNVDPKKAITPEEVADVVIKALTTRRPRSRYAAGREAKVMTRLAPLLPERVLDSLRTHLIKI